MKFHNGKTYEVNNGNSELIPERTHQKQSRHVYVFFILVWRVIALYKNIQSFVKSDFICILKYYAIAFSLKIIFG